MFKRKKETFYYAGLEVPPLTSMDRYKCLDDATKGVLQKASGRIAFIMFVFYNEPSIAMANAQQIVKDNTSTIVVMKGDATTAGSKRHFSASNGKIEPINFAITIVANMEILITNATNVPLSTK